MTTKVDERELGNLVEQKILEFFGDPDSGLTLKKNFVVKLKRRMNAKQKLFSHSSVLKKYGVS